MGSYRHGRPGSVSPGSLAASLGIAGLMVLGMVFAAPHVGGRAPETHLTIEDIAIPPTPPPDPVRVEPRTPQPTQISALQPIVIVPLPPVAPVAAVDPPALPMGLPTPGDVVGPVAEPSPLPPPPPTLVAPEIDARYADAFQPTYPPEERRAEHEGHVVVRVLVGVDGRVKQVEQVSADSDAFFLATRRQALARWRFRPATRGDVPVEGWKTMSVRFVLENE